MPRLLLLPLLLIALFSGCSLQPTPGAGAKQEPLYVDENTLMLFALDAQSRGNSVEAVGYYDLLYEKTNEKLYRDQALSVLVQGRYFDTVVSRISSMRQNGEELSEQNQRYLVVALLAKQDFEGAKKEALDLTQKSQDEDNYLLLADVYLMEKEYDKALESMEMGYRLNYSESILEKISLLMYTNMGLQEEATERIEQHIEHFGYSLLLTKRLVSFYGDSNNEEGLLRVYPRLYELEPSDYHAGILIQLYWNAKKVPALKQFLESSGRNDDLLLKIYMGEKLYTKAIALSGRLYDETGDVEYLGQQAIFRYEAAKDKSDAKLLDSVISDLKKVVEVKEEGYYLNYLGYCMIESDRDIDAGIAYVKRALAIEPDSGYFIDSLAWGYYKQGRCEEAYELMQRVVEIMGADDIEVKAHLKAISACKKGKK